MASRKQKLALSEFRLKNFKAVKDSGIVKFTPLTVFIGNNGVGKSSLMEGLEALQGLARDGIIEAFKRWHGIGSVINQSEPPSVMKTATGKEYLSNTLEFHVRGMGFARRAEGVDTRPFSATSSVALSAYEEQTFFLKENVTHYDGRRVIAGATRIWPNRVEYDENIGGEGARMQVNIVPYRSMLYSEEVIDKWQFVRLDPEKIGEPSPFTNLLGDLPLATDGSNIAAYLDELWKIDSTIIDGIVETVKALLPYVVNIQPVRTVGFNREIIIQVTEKDFQIPGWLLSTGTQRLIALLALFRHPIPPPLIVIEEIENGLDPRSIALIIEEIRGLVTSGRSQVIVTTHSPYLLDMVPLSSIVHVERVDGEPKFFRPADDERTRRWNESFTPGKLYTMGTLGRPTS